jgi:hypothetical protein
MTPYGIRQQFPKEIEDNRRKLYPIQKEAKRQGKHVVLVRDRLYIDNELYVTPHECDQMDDIERTRSAENVLATPATTGGRRPPKRRNIKFVVNVETVSDKYNMFSQPFRFFLNRI